MSTKIFENFQWKTLAVHNSKNVYQTVSSLSAADTVGHISIILESAPKILKKKMSKTSGFSGEHCFESCINRRCQLQSSSTKILVYRKFPVGSSGFHMEKAFFSRLLPAPRITVLRMNDWLSPQVKRFSNLEITIGLCFGILRVRRLRFSLADRA